MNVQPSGSSPRGIGSTSLPGSSPGWAVLGGVGLLALLDAGIETIASGSPLRWRLGVPAIVLTVLVALAWRPAGALRRRWGWKGAASAPFVALLLLLALTAWLPGGQFDGLRLLRQHTSAILAIVSAMAVALAGFVLVRVRILPAWARAALGALAVYGIVAYAAGAARGTLYAPLLHGASAWARLPFWLQGAFLGGLVLLPVALVVSVVRGGLRHLHGTGGWNAHEIVALALSLVMTVSGVFTPGPAAPPQGQAAAGPDRQAGPPPIEPGAVVPPDVKLELPSSVTVEPTAEELKARYDTVVQRIPDTRYDVSAQGRALGPDVEKAFAFVRDRIRYEAYSGILRGAGGTLAALAGNSFDRSVLLADMLAASGVKTRFARCELPRREADVLFARMFETAPAPPAAASSNDAGAARPFWSRVTARARRDYTVIRSALGDAVPPAGQAWRAQALRDIQQHVFLQAEAGGRWIDLDTAFAAAKPGTTYCSSTQTVDRPPDGWHQRVTLRVIAERLEGSALGTTTVLETTRPAVDLVDQQVFLLHVPERSGGGGMGLDPTAGSGGGDAWTPTLLVGGRSQAGKTISFGDSQESGGFLGSLGGGGSSSFVAEWLELEIARPDGRRDVTRRSLVDRGTAVWRSSPRHEEAGLRPLARDKDGLAAPRAVRNIWFSAGPHDLRAYADSIMDAAAAAEDDEPTLEGQLLPIATANFAALVWADHSAIPAVNDLPQVRLYPDSPRIVIVSAMADGKGGGVEEFDLRRDWLWGVARDASGDGLVVDRKIWFGALEGALEHESIASSLAMTGEDASKAVSTSSLLAADGVVVIKPSDLPRLAELTPDRERAERLAVALRRGSVLVVPRRALASGPPGWWEFAPGGDARAVLDDELNLSRGNVNFQFTSNGTPRARATRQSFRVTEPQLKNKPRNPFENFGKNRPRPKKEEGRGGTEYALLNAVMAIASIGLISYVAYGVYRHHQRMAEFDALDAAAQR